MKWISVFVMAWTLLYTCPWCGGKFGGHYPGCPSGYGGHKFGSRYDKDYGGNVRQTPSRNTQYNHSQNK